MPATHTRARGTALRLTLAVAMCSAGSAGASDDATPAQFGESEKTFIDQVAAQDLGEIELSRLLQHKSSSKALRRLAHAVLADDTANYEQLFQLCLRRHYPIAPQLDERHRKLLQQVRAARSPAALGRKYIDTLLVDQAGMDALLVTLAAQGPAGDIEQFASDTAQMSARHERMARALASK